MSSLLNVFQGRRSKPDYSSNEALFQGLQAEASGAIQHLYAQMTPYVFKTGKAAGLPNEDMEELIGDAIALFLIKIRNGQYVFQGFSPVSYAIEIAKNKMLHRLRALQRKQRTTELPDGLAETLLDTDENNADWNVVQRLESLLDQLPPNCRRLIRLKYLDEMRDKDVLAQQLTTYTTVDALKTHRYQCMKKLTELATSKNQQ